jgi:hypothetical protein
LLLQNNVKQVSNNEQKNNYDEQNSNYKKSLLALAALKILTSPLDYRTYTGCFAYNIRESDYDGSRSGIAYYVADMAEEFFKVPDFLQVFQLNEDVGDVEGLITESFYIPAFKSLKNKKMRK